jgi:anti-sigma B factor antagonist
VIANLWSATSTRHACAASGMPSPGPHIDLLTVTAYPAPSSTPPAIVLAVRGAVDTSTSPWLRDDLLSRLRDAVPQVILDLTGVGFLSAAGLTTLVTVVDAAVAAEVELRVVASTRPVLVPLTITGLDDVLDICPDVASALHRAGSPDTKRQA